MQFTLAKIELENRKNGNRDQEKWDKLEKKQEFDTLPNSSVQP